jgi:predicted SAM-dependent methyltransferase
VTLKQRVGRLVYGHLPVTRFLFDQLRIEGNAALSRAERSLSPSVRSRLGRLRRQQHLRVNVACGPQVLAGFVNLDLFPCSDEVLRFDCRRGLPLADASAEVIKVEHYVEHLEPREELPAFLADCHRVLEPGGILRIVVPDTERYVRAYCSGEGHAAFRELGISTWPADLPTRMDVLNHVFHQWHEHRWGYDFETTACRLAAAGFRSVERSCFGHSRAAALTGSDLPVHAPYSLYVEAAREGTPS